MAPASPKKVISPGKPKPAATGAPKNAFDFMKTAAKASSSAAKASTGSGGEGKGKAVAGTGGGVEKEAIMFSRSAFKGSGLGAGPKHRVEEKDQPWVEK